MVYCADRSCGCSLQADDHWIVLTSFGTNERFECGGNTGGFGTGGGSAVGCAATTGAADPTVQARPRDSIPCPHPQAPFTLPLLRQAIAAYDWHFVPANFLAVGVETCSSYQQGDCVQAGRYSPNGMLKLQHGMEATVTRGDLPPVRMQSNSSFCPLARNAHRFASGHHHVRLGVSSRLRWRELQGAPSASTPLMKR